MNYRYMDKQFLKGYLELIVFDGNPISIFTNHVRSEEVPYCLVTSAGGVPNEGGSSMHDNGNYKRGYRYQIHLIWKAKDDESKSIMTEDAVDELEAQFWDKLQSSKVRDCQELEGEEPRDYKWLDLVMDGEVSSPFSGKKIQLSDNHIVKTFPVKIQRMVAYD